MSLTFSARVRVRQFLALVAVVSLCAPPAGAFDTFWHSAATSAAGKQLGFTDDSINIVQFGNFSGHDFFGPLYDTILGERLEDWSKVSQKRRSQLQDFDAFRKKNIVIRKRAIFLHFDNLYGKLDSNAKFDYLFERLLQNTKKTITEFYSNGAIGERHRKILVLMTLGGSLHMVQDFYSHSNWIHHDFEKLGLPLVQLPWGKPRAPTWFEVKAKLGDPAGWPFTVVSGVYPPPAYDTPNSHTHMNHDNSQLIYDGEPQVKYHNRGPLGEEIPFPASQSVTEHQLFAANTAAGASIEWIQMLMEDAQVKAALEFAKGIKLQRNDPMVPFLTSALASTLLMSCVAKGGKWDGPKPPPRRQRECDGIYMVAAPTAAGAIFPGAGVPGFYDVTPSPYNEFWGMHVKYNIVERLTQGFGSQEGRYVFPQ